MRNPDVHASISVVFGEYSLSVDSEGNTSYVGCQLPSSELFMDWLYAIWVLVQYPPLEWDSLLDD